METSHDITSVGPVPKMALEADVGTAVTLPLDELESNPFQPRTVIDERALLELVASIRAQGLLVPIAVRRVPSGGSQRYQVIAGHRRLEAFKRLRAEAGDTWARIPALWRQDVDDAGMEAFALIENLQRHDLSPLDEALGLLHYQEHHALSAEAVAKRLGLELDRVKRLLRLSRAPKVVQDACGGGVVVESAADGAKRERMRLDVMAALEFARLHAHVFRTTPKAAGKAADERVARAIERALSERWAFRRIQTFCKAAISGRPPSADARKPERRAAADDAPPPSLFTEAGDDLHIRRGAIAAASSAERFALLEVLRALIPALAGAEGPDGRGNIAPAVARPVA